MLKVLRLASNNPLVWQRGLLQTELKEIFENAPDPGRNAGVMANSAVQKEFAKMGGEDIDDDQEDTSQ